MGLILTDHGAEHILDAYLNNTWPASKDLRVQLFCNNIATADNTVIGGLTIATGGGYTYKTLANGSWTVNATADPRYAIFAEQTWTFTGPLTTNPTIYGYGLVDNDGAGVLIWFEKLAASFTPANNGDQLKITPRFELSKGTPT